MVLEEDENRGETENSKEGDHRINSDLAVKEREQQQKDYWNVDYKWKEDILVEMESFSFTFQGKVTLLHQ